MYDLCSFANPTVHTELLPTVRELLILLEARHVTCSQGLLKVKRWWHPQVLVQMFTVRYSAAQSGTPGKGSLGEKGHYKPGCKEVKQDVPPVDLELTSLPD